jgi:uncharacterized membrane protein
MARLDQAKRPVTLLAGPYGVPFHPKLVPVAIGAWIASLVFDIASRVSDEPEVFAKGAYWLILLGVAGALVAALFGFLDLVGIPTGTKAFRIGLVHMTLNLVTTGLFGVSIALRQGDVDDPGETSAGLLVLSAVAVGTLAVAGWLGGELSFRYGVRVADEGTQLEGYIEEGTD